MSELPDAIEETDIPPNATASSAEDTPHSETSQVDASAAISPMIESERSSRDVLYEAIGLQLVNAGVLTPARDFIDDVRREAGTRVSPRDIAAIVTQMNVSHGTVSAAAVAQIATSSTGGRSQRQGRNADQWRALGAALALRDLDGSADGQRAFVGEARRLAGRDGSDALILQIALALAEIGSTFDAETVGKIGKRLAASAPDISPDSMRDIVHSELRSLHRAQRAEALDKRKKRSSSGARRPTSNYLSNPGARKMRPGRKNIRALPAKGSPPERD